MWWAQLSCARCGGTGAGLSRLGPRVVFCLTWSAPELHPLSSPSHLCIVVQMQDVLAAGSAALFSARMPLPTTAGSAVPSFRTVPALLHTGAVRLPPGMLLEPSSCRMLVGSYSDAGWQCWCWWGPVVMQVPHGCAVQLTAVSVECDLRALRCVCFAFLSAAVPFFYIGSCSVVWIFKQLLTE